MQLTFLILGGVRKVPACFRSIAYLSAEINRKLVTKSVDMGKNLMESKMENSKRKRRRERERDRERK